MVNVPAPAVDGVNVVPVTPVPEKVPPAGVPLSITGDALIHMAATGLIDTTGNALTVMEAVVELVHPLVAFV